MLCGLAKVEFIRTCTQVGKMIAADKFKSTEIEPQGLGETSISSAAHPRKRDIFREHSTQFMTDSPRVYLGQAFSSVTWMR